jgi:hypothetical protein
MTRRLVAAIAGAVVLLGVFLAYSVDERPMVAGSNTVAPFYPALTLPRKSSRCQEITHVPAKANRVRVIASAVPDAPAELGVKLVDPSGVNTKGIKKDLRRGPLAIGLNRLTRSAQRGGICFYNYGDAHLVLAGEDKLVKGGRAGKKQGVASVVFVRPRLSTWGAQRDVIAERFANAQPGAFGGWSLWFAVLLAAAATGLALWWLVFRLEPRSE